MSIQCPRATYLQLYLAELFIVAGTSNLCNLDFYRYLRDIYDVYEKHTIDVHTIFVVH